jgi:hypothetical protein
MSKEFVTYEQALALKELGFDEPSISGYSYPNSDKLLSQAILYQQAFRFLYKELGRDGFGIMPIDIDKCNKELNKLIEIVKETNNE